MFEMNELTEKSVAEISAQVDIATAALEQTKAEIRKTFNEKLAIETAKRVSQYAYWTDIDWEHCNLDEYKNQYYPSGFSNLDAILDGGFYPGLYILGAISSLGKTSFVLQVADQIAATGADVLYFSLEMAADELVSRSLSRLTYQLCDGHYYAAKTTRGIMAPPTIYKQYNDREISVIQKARAEYAVTGGHLYIYEGIGDIGTEQIKNQVELHRQVKEKKSVVIIDYLQILAPHDVRASDKQNTDKAVLELKRMSRDFNIPVIAISSFNRDSYTNEVTQSSFKESGAIEYGSDVLLAIQPQGMLPGFTKADQKKNVLITSQCIKSPVRDVEVKVLKNRNGETGGRIGFVYRPKYNLFEEVANYKPKEDLPLDDDLSDFLPFD